MVDSEMELSSAGVDPDAEYGEESEGLPGITKEDLEDMSEGELAAYKKEVAHRKWRAKLPVI